MQESLLYSVVPSSKNNSWIGGPEYSNICVGEVLERE